MNNIVVYSTEHCIRCDQLKEFFKINNIDFIEKSMNDPHVLTELAMNNIFINIASVLQINEDYYTHKMLFINNKINDVFLLNKLGRS